MALISGSYYRGDPNVKPACWGSPVDVQAALRDRLERLGIAWEDIFLAMPFWSYPHDYSQFNRSSTLIDTGSITFKQNRLKFDGNANADRIDLGSIAADDPLSGYERQELCFLLGLNDTGLTTHNRYPRIIDKSSGSNFASGWGVYRISQNLCFYQSSSRVTYETPKNKDITIGLRAKSGDLAIFLDGIKVETSASTFTFPAKTTSAAVGNWNHSTDRNWHGDILQVIVGAGWTEAQLAELSANPYQLWQPAVRTIYSMPDSTVSPINCSLSLSSGAYSSLATIEITADVSGATIYYTIDGTDPDETSSVYTEAIAMFEGTLKAYAVASGYDDSGVVTATYTIADIVCSLSLSAGQYPSSYSIEITADVAGATIYYTTDGSTPTTSSSVYSGAIAMFEGTLKAYAVASGYDDSGVVEAAFAVGGAVVGDYIDLAAAGTWSGSVTALSYQWQRDGVDINGETDDSYVTTDEDEGAEITVFETATGLGGSAVAVSNTITVFPIV